MSDTIGINPPNKILNNKPRIEIIEVDISFLCPSYKEQGQFIWGNIPNKNLRQYSDMMIKKYVLGNSCIMNEIEETV